MVDPHGMTLQQWADSTILSFGDAWSFGRLDDEERWQDWGASFLRANHTSAQAPPDPYQFDDWREWAMRMYPLFEANS